MFTDRRKPWRSLPAAGLRAGPRILIGGLGMGFTLAAALKHLGAGAELIVAELVPKVIEWNRGPLGEEAGNPLLDKRVTVKEGDVAKMLMAEKRAFDAILLDVDNGPNGLTHHDNDWLYSVPGLNGSYRALKPGGGYRFGRPDRMCVLPNDCTKPGFQWKK